MTYYSKYDYLKPSGEVFPDEESDGSSLKRAVESAVSDTELAKVTDQLYRELRGLSVDELQEFRRSLSFVLRLAEEIDDLEDEEIDAAVEFLKARREKSAVESGDKKPKVKILDPPYVVDPEPEE